MNNRIGKVGILMGGPSSERDISLKSGHAIEQALREEGYETVPLDIQNDDPIKISEFIQTAQIDIAFIALHGRCGEDGTIQSILECLDIPYTGSDVESSQTAMNKVLTQPLLKENNITIPPNIALSRNDVCDQTLLKDSLGPLPYVVKPACEGSSFGITLVEQQEDLIGALNKAWEFDDMALVEKFIKGRELTVGILDDRALPVVEICPGHAFFDYISKYETGMSEYLVPAPLDESLLQKLKDTALNVFHAVGCRHFARVDFILDEKCEPFVLEINTIPGFTQTSLLPKAAAADGINFHQLCSTILGLAYGKKKEKSGFSITA